MDRSVYDAANSGAIVVDRPDRGLVRVHGRDPVRMVHGLASNDVQSLGPGRSVYATLLTPKGRMLADPRIIRRAGDLLLEADAAAVPNILDIFRRSVPPLFARAEPLDGQLCVVGVYGPASAALVAGVIEVATPVSVPEGDDSVSGLPAGGERSAAAALTSVGIDDSTAGSFAGEEVFVLRTDAARTDGWEIVVACDLKDSVINAVVDAGAVPGDPATLEVLRIEAGRPRWGAELTEDVIPLEAGLKDRAISTSKGCYTGQEVVIRILHRGHVNRHLRGLVLGGPASVGDELFHTEIRAGKPLGVLTSVVASPRLGDIALGYVRREVEPGTSVHVGSPDGPTATVIALPFELPGSPSTV